MQGITPEMARAELERRKQSQQPAMGSPSSSSITPDMARAELARRQTQNGSRGTMGKFESALEGFNTGVERFAHGVTQPLLESGLFGDNLKKGSQEYARQREERYENALASNPKTAKVAELIGGIGATTPLMAIPGFGKNAIGRALTQGAIQGTAMGAGQYTKDNSMKDRAVNALLGGGLGAAAYPLTKALSSSNPMIKAGTGAAIGGAIGGGMSENNPHSELIGTLTGAAAPFIPGMAKNALLNLFNKGKSKLTGSEYEAARTPLQNQVSRDMFAQVNPQEALKRKEAAERLRLSYLTPAEASGSPVAGAAQGNVGKTKEGGQLLHERGLKRLESEKNSIKSLYHDIYPKNKELLEKEKSLYEMARSQTVDNEKLKTLMEDPVIGHAIENVIKKPAFAKDLADTKIESVKYLDYTKKYIDDMIGKANRAGEKNEVRLLTDSKQKLTAMIDEAAPEYQQAREIAARRLTRQEFEKSLNDKELRGTNFYQKLLRNDKKFEEMRNKVKEIPGAQQKLDDMRLVFQDLINPPTARTAAGLAKTKMTNARSTKEAIMDKAKEMLGGRYDKAAVNLITSPKWDKEFYKIREIENQDKRAIKFTDLLARISTSIGSQTAAENNQ